MYRYNQTYNVAVNYANRNVASTLDNTQLAAAYTLGVGSACGSAYGFAKLTDRMVKRYPRGASTLKM